jgi:hypothetical protein
VKINLLFQLDDECRRAIALSLGRNGKKPATRTECVQYIQSEAFGRIEHWRRELRRRIANPDPNQLMLIPGSEEG